MGKVRITRQWPDGEVLVVSVVADASYPDALAEARATAMQALREATETVVTVELEEPDTEE